jgi:hypothetical protein
MSLITGRIYRIICYSDPSINYIGSTFDTLRNRWQRHKIAYSNNKARKLSIYQYFDKTGIDDFKMLLIKEYQVVDKAHLKAYEQLWINKTNCVNMYNTFKIKYLSLKLYRSENSDKLKIKQQEYYKTNHEKLKQQRNTEEFQEYSRIYRENNREKLIDNSKKHYEKARIDRYTCECGIELACVSKAGHDRSKRHLHFLAGKLS